MFDRFTVNLAEATAFYEESSEFDTSYDRSGCSWSTQLPEPSPGFHYDADSLLSAFYEKFELALEELREEITFSWGGKGKCKYNTEKGYRLRLDLIDEIHDWLLYDTEEFIVEDNQRFLGLDL